MSGEKYFQSDKTRPSKNVSGGYGKYCCIPGCKSAAEDSNRKKTGISLFKIPAKEPDRSNWIRVIRNYRRKGGKDNFDPSNKNVHICEFHFKSEDIKVSLGIGRKTIKTGVIQSILERNENWNL